jgi:hypothetical protein
MESRSKSGDTVTLHIHAALAAQKQISAPRMKAIWQELTGRRTAQGEDGIQIAPWKQGAGGIEYILKLAGISVYRSVPLNLHAELHSAGCISPRRRVHRDADGIATPKVSCSVKTPRASEGTTSEALLGLLLISYS